MRTDTYEAECEITIARDQLGNYQNSKPQFLRQSWVSDISGAWDGSRGTVIDTSWPETTEDPGGSAEVSVKRAGNGDSPSGSIEFVSPKRLRRRRI